MPEIPPIRPIDPAERLKQDNKRREPKPENNKINQSEEKLEEQIPDPKGRGRFIDEKR